MRSVLGTPSDSKGLTSEEVDIHFITTLILSFFSFIPNIFLVILIIMRKKYHNAGNILVFQLSIACILFISSYCFPILDDDTPMSVCNFQALVNISFDMSTMFFTLGIAYTNYAAFVEPYKFITHKKAILITISVVSWLIPLTFGISGIVFNKFELGTTKICWSRDPLYVIIFGCSS